MVELSAYIPAGHTCVQRLVAESKKEGIWMGQIGTHRPDIGSPICEVFEQFRAGTQLRVPGSANIPPVQESEHSLVRLSA